jgi:hypothetical protein
MRIVLVILLVYGLLPGIGEVAETVTHYVAEGHLAHSDADQGDLGDQGDEHGCGTTEHRCTCCASQDLGVAAAGPVLPDAPPASRASGDCRRLATLHHPEPPVRPPISS